MRFLLLSLCLTFGKLTAQTGPTTTPSTYETKTQKMQAFKGYFNFFWDEKEGKIWLEIDKIDKEFLYVHSLPSGVGSNDIGLDRGQIIAQRCFNPLIELWVIFLHCVDNTYISV